MLKRWTWLMMLMIVLAAFAGCSSDDPTTPTPTPTQTPFEAVAAAGALYVNSADCPGVISATALHDNLGDYTVIDIRSEAAYTTGHIPGAYNEPVLTSLLGDLGTTIPTDKPIVLTCYSGQSAGHAKIALELMGYTDVYTLGYGMAAWNSENSATWDNAVGDNLTNPETTNNNADLVEHAFPELTGDVAGIVATRVNAMLAGGFKSIAYSAIKDNLDEYFIINYFAEADYLGTGTSGTPGHIPGAFQFTPGASLGADQMLKYLPTDKPIVVYCWTGQTSSQITAYLNMLGYEAYSLRNGANNLFHGNLTAHMWTGAQDYDMTVGYEPNAAFRAVAEAGAAYVNSSECPGVISATALNDNLENYTVIDIRAADAYNAGHIPGAYHSSLAAILSDVGTTIPTDLPLVVACYSGQTAGHAKIALELMGYGDVYTLGFGMCSWNSSLAGSWTSGIGNTLTNPETSNNNPGLTVQAYPTLDGETAATVVANRVAAMVAGGLKGVMYTDIQDNLEDYFIINYFGIDDYEGNGTAGVPGHIPGAYQFTPGQSLGIGQMLHNIPTDRPVVVYCWTSQTSSQVTAYLNMLGYDAYSLKFGSNNLFYDNLSAHKWTAAADYPLETSLVTN